MYRLYNLTKIFPEVGLPSQVSPVLSPGLAQAGFNVFGPPPDLLLDDRIRDRGTVKAGSKGVDGVGRLLGYNLNVSSRDHLFTGDGMSARTGSIPALFPAADRNLYKKGYEKLTFFKRIRIVGIDPISDLPPESSNAS